MGRFSNFFAAGIFIIFLAVLFHYFCRVRKKPEMIIQQRVQLPEGYVYPIAANTPGPQLSLSPNFGHLHPPYMTSSLPYPTNVPVPPYPYTPSNHTNVPATTRNDVFSNPTRPNQPDDDLPPPYHVAVAGGPYSQV